MGTITRRRVTDIAEDRRIPRGRAAVLLLAAVLALSGEARAQEPPPPPPPPVDTIPADPARPADPAEAMDTVPVDGDSVPVEPADTLEPVRVFVAFPGTVEPRWSNGVWEWDRDLIQRSAAVTLTDLLETIPGITPIRSGFLGSAEAVNAFGSTAGRIELVLDGFVLDPLDAGTYDLSRFELGQLERVRVRRRGDGLRIEVETLSPSRREPLSVIEAGTGDLRTNLFRGVFLTPDFLIGPLSLGIDRFDTRGFMGREPANTFSGWAKWGIVTDHVGFELEYRSHSLERTLANGIVGLGERKDWVARLRGAPIDGLTAEAFYGVSSIEDDWNDEEVIEDRASQAGVRAQFDHERGWATALFRHRDHDLLPAMETEFAAGLRLPGGVGVSGDVTAHRWDDDEKTLSYSLRADVGPVLGIRPFVETSSGSRGVPGLRSEDGRTLVTERTSHRAGLEFSSDGIHLGAATVILDTDSIADFGLPFDRTARLHPAGRLTGAEFVGRVPLPFTPFALEANYTHWDDAGRWIYTPSHELRTAIAYHGFPLGHERLEVTARLERGQLGEMRVPDADGTLALVPARTAYDFYLQVRIVDVRAFVRWENILNNVHRQYLPGRYMPGQRVFYGVKWELWN